jgi:hypothetical protein
MAVMEIKKDLSTKDVVVFALLVAAFFALLGWLCVASPETLRSAAAFTGVCVVAGVLLCREQPLRLRSIGVVVPALLLSAGYSGWIAEELGFRLEAGQRFAALTLTGVGLAGGVFALAFRRFGRRLYEGWMLASLPIAWVVSHVVLAAVFYLLITPISLLMRLGGRDPLLRQFDGTATTYWLPRRPPAQPDRYLRQS